VEREAPFLKARDADGNEHQVWRVTDSAIIQQIQRALADKDLYIADGHHRYETAVNYMNECTQHSWRPAAPESFDVRMMTLFNVAEPGMSIRPTHRLVHGIEGLDPETFLEAASEHFRVQAQDSLEAMIAATSDGRARHTFGCVTAGSFTTLQLKDESAIDALVEPDRSADYKRLDVTILHSAILERLLGIDAKALEEERNITYIGDVKRAASLVQSGQEQLLFYLNATSPEEVVRVADHNEKMPQKSTDFYPKLLTGLVLMKMEIAK
jgi:uncharacterized protein (DUF1015 family)